MPDIDRDDAMNTFVRGPGRSHRHRSAGAVFDAYTTTGAINRLCPNCGAKPQAYCCHPDGTQRKMPCPQRLSERPGR